MWDFLINIALLIVVALTYVISGGFATDAARRTTDIDGYSTNQKLISAHKYLSIAAVIVWLSVGILVLVMILVVVAGVFFSPEEAAVGAGAVGLEAGVEGAEVGSEAAYTGLDFLEGAQKTQKAQSSFSIINLLIYGAMGLLLIGVIIVGILSAVAATDIGQANVKDDKGAYKQSIIACCIAIPVFALIIIYFIYKFYTSYKTN